jgi:hypothetical protein
MSADSEKQVLDYLDRVADEAQRRIRHPAERIRLVEELRARIENAAARRGNQPKAVRKILAELGPAEQQVDEFLVRGSPSGPSVPPPRPGSEEVARPAPPRSEVRARAEAGARTEPVPRSERAEPAPRGEPGARPDLASPSATPPPGAARPEPAPAPPAAAPRVEPSRPAVRGGEPPRASAEAATAPVQPTGQPGVVGPAIRTERSTVAGMPEPAFIAVVLLGVAVLTLLLGWIGWLIGALLGLKWPTAARGVRVVALLTIPLAGLPVFLLLGFGTDVDEVMSRVYPLVVGLLGAAFLLWGHFRYRPPAERRPPPPAQPRRPQRRLVPGLSRHSRG